MASCRPTITSLVSAYFASLCVFVLVRADRRFAGMCPLRVELTHLGAFSEQQGQLA